MLKNPETLYENRGEHSRMQDALKLNESLTIGYYLKEDLRQIWSSPTSRRQACFWRIG